jgi:hypothetical protein
LLSDYGITKENDLAIMYILSKLKAHFDIFLYNFYSTRDALGANYKMPTFEVFCENLTHEKDKHLHMGAPDIGKKKSLFAYNNKCSKTFRKQFKGTK